MDALIQDVRYGIRQLFRQRGSSAVAVLTLALGIGISSALFSVIDATLSIVRVASAAAPSPRAVPSLRTE
jgi:hypothetical protein